MRTTIDIDQPILKELKRRGKAEGKSLGDELCYWAPAQGGTEVDFLMRRGSEFIGIEVKATANPGSSEYTGLRSIAALPSVKRRLLVHLGERAFTTPDGVEALPAMEFARELAEGRI